MGSALFRPLSITPSRNNSGNLGDVVELEKVFGGPYQELWDKFGERYMEFVVEFDDRCVYPRGLANNNGPPNLPPLNPVTPGLPRNKLPASTQPSPPAHPLIILSLPA